MVVVAVAGGSSGLGLTIVQALTAQGKHEVLILSRKENTELGKRLGALVVAVDYRSAKSIESALEANNVDTVICTISSQGDLEPEQNLILAADRSPITRRIIPSIFAGFTYPVKYPDSSPVAKAKSEAIKAVKRTSLEYTAIYNGIFLDYYAAPQLKANIPPWPLFVDILHESAAVPGSGDDLVVFTHSTDIAKFVVSSLDLPKWREESYILGEKLTWHEIIKLAEDAKGSKFNVMHDSETDLRAGRVSMLPSYGKMFQLPEADIQDLLSTAGMWFVNKELDLNPEHALNKKFPEIKPMKVKDFLESSWNGTDATVLDIKM
ncbi:hypothetical protein N7537_009502 [Penicillium hordei]|uniref:NmrA-like domain-containing protein n=1 Tax=Penicillium hordei TaxID=40994 RepID=A0AAD6DT03_9EURO|nr:uncharacterized protein N7537_009502 [Penicillium hordei]KAJ5592598.1 hypothetical protein N7537_009502 [Penicillium hordei]